MSSADARRGHGARLPNSVEVREADRYLKARQVDRSILGNASHELAARSSVTFSILVHCYTQRRFTAVVKIPAT